MNRKMLHFILLMCAVLLFSFSPVTANADAPVVWDGTAQAPTQGAGTSVNPYQIGTAAELAWFAGQVDSGRVLIEAILVADIALNDTTGWESWATTPPANTWIPIGENGNPFRGSFDGNNHTISGVYINSSTIYQGLFGAIQFSTIKNVTLNKVLVENGIVNGSGDTLNPHGMVTRAEMAQMLYKLLRK
ncbi:MAG: S-layer homology domain-containing protein [Thermoclostridium sp.]|nr:S-layer homology domain-containing protein [Thermoclostridium sp.]